MLAWYRELIALRRDRADLTNSDLAAVRVAYDEGARWIAYRRGDLRVAVNLSGEPAAVPVGRGTYRVLAAWEPVGLPGEDGLLTVPPESCAVLVGP